MSCLMCAVRIVAERLQDCYAALGIVHTHYRHLPDEFDDYVANPKPNGYQSIHTVVLGPGGKTVEIQIRTRQMHEDAELGVAAHWKYKEGAGAAAGGGRGYEDRIAWLRKLIAWQEEMADSGEMLDEVRSQVFDDRVYVFTPKGDVVDLPAGSTPLDFAYHIHSDVGHRCIGAKISGRIVPFTYQLQMGDQIEIITQKQPNPSRDWLNPTSAMSPPAADVPKSTPGSASRIATRIFSPGGRFLMMSLSTWGLASRRQRSICCRATTSMSWMSCWRPLAAEISALTRWSTSCRRSLISRAPKSRMRRR
jgi:hypothetical protein